MAVAENRPSAAPTARQTLARKRRPAVCRQPPSAGGGPPAAGQPPNVQRLHTDVVCRLRHLGRVIGTLEQTVTFTSPTTVVATNTGTYTAANGDQLFAAWSGAGTFSDPTTVAFRGTETYRGGTGRFADASGSAELAGGASLFTLTGFYEYEPGGTLRY